MADVNVLDLTQATPGTDDSLILFDRNTGEAKSTRYDTLKTSVLTSKFGDSSPAAGEELSYDAATGKYKNTSQIASLKETFTNNGAHNLFDVGDNIDDWFLAHNNGLSITDKPGSDRITATVNSENNSINVTAYDTSGFFWGCKRIELKKNTNYRFSWAFANGAIQLFGKNNNSENGVLIGGFSSGVLNSGNYDWWYIGFYPGNNFSISKFLVMLASDTDSTYTSYAKTNQQLTKDDSGLTANAFANGAVNLLPNTVQTYVESGINITKNNDGTITINGTATADVYIRVRTGLALETNKRYKLSGCPSGGSYDKYYLIFYNGSIFDYGEGKVFTPTTITSDIDIVIKKNVVCTSLKFKPMITVADMPNSDYDHYVPYVKSNKELTEYSNGTSSITYGTNVIYASLCYVRKVGRIVQFSMGLQLTSDKASDSLLVNLPYKPMEQTFFVACNSQTNKSYVVSMNSTSGNISVAYNTSMPAGYYWFSGAYITGE